MPVLFDDETAGTGLLHLAYRVSGRGGWRDRQWLVVVQVGQRDVDHLGLELRARRRDVDRHQIKATVLAFVDALDVGEAALWANHLISPVRSRSRRLRGACSGRP